MNQTNKNAYMIFRVCQMILRQPLHVIAQIVQYEGGLGKAHIAVKIGQQQDFQKKDIFQCHVFQCQTEVSWN